MGAITTPEAHAGRSIMVIDDDGEAREILGLERRAHGYSVIECRNGVDALERLRAPRKPDVDVIVLDLLMPVMDGWRFRVEQKRDPALATIPVLALSGDESPKAAAIDAEVYLTKPALPEAIVAAVDRPTLEMDRRALQAHLAQVSRLSSLGTLAAGMAHEINNPLAFVLLNLEFLRAEVAELLADRDESPSHGERERHIAQVFAEIQSGAERIRDIVHGLKTFARPELEARGSVDVLAVVKASIAMVAHEIRRRARLTTDFDPCLPPVVGNEARLGQVFLNLLLNAVQSLPEDQVSVQEVRVIAKAHANRVVVEVHDTGAGVPPEIRGRIFEPFFTTKPVGSGTGLGLAICHGIVSAHGGTMSVDSEPGKGSCFRVELPVALNGKP
ncbi:MAG: sensor histidine kinase [Polyangiaceae bacterium]